MSRDTELASIMQATDRISARVDALNIAILGAASLGIRVDIEISETHYSAAGTPVALLRPLTFYYHSGGAK